MSLLFFFVTKSEIYVLNAATTATAQQDAPEVVLSQSSVRNLQALPNGGSLFSGAVFNNCTFSFGLPEL